MTDRHLLIIDFEATCWESGSRTSDDAKEHQEIIEIGYALVNLTQGYVVNNNGIYVRPQRSTVSEYCFNLTGISQSKLDSEGLPSLPAAFAQLKAEIGSIKKHVWGSWGTWDLDLIRSEARRVGMPSPLSRYYINLKAEYALRYAVTKFPGMADALTQQGMPLEGRHHSGKSDCYNLAKLALLMYPTPAPIPNQG